MKLYKKVYIEITNVCNLTCDFCPKTSRQPKRMTYDEFEQVVKAVKPYTDYVYLHLLGEPTLHPQLGDFLRLCKEEGLKVNLTTNGTLLHRVEETLLGSPAVRQINISLHSFESNEMTVEVESYMRQVLHFVKQAVAKSQIICSLRLWNLDTKSLKANNTLNAQILALLEEELELDFEIASLLVTQTGVKLKERVYLNMAEKFEWPEQTQGQVFKQVFCYGLRDQIGILVDGTVVPCCLDSEGKIGLGNVFEIPLEDIIQSERSRAIYEGFSNRQAVEKVCQGCGYAKQYHK